MYYVLALDQGTTSSRAIVFDRDGRVVSRAQREFRQRYPRAGWVEHDPSEISSTQILVARQALETARLSRADLAGVGIANQRETTILWDRSTGEPIYNAIVWQDRRTADFCDALKRDGMESLFRERTGLVIDPYFAGTKIRWILDNVPDARARAERGELAFGTVDSWLVWNLSDGAKHVTDVTNAGRTLLFNIHTCSWDEALLEALAIPRELLPEVASSSEVYAEWEGVPIAGMAGDQHAALFGQLCFEPGMAKNTYGTGCFLLLQTGDKPQESENKLLSTLAWREGGQTQYALEGSIFIGGAVVQWLRDGLKIIGDASEIEALAASVPDTGGVCFVPAFAGLGAPHWDPYARGALIGMTRGTTRAHIARAALEAIAFQSCDVLKAMERDASLELTELRVDGGASVNDLLMQTQADLLQVPVVRPKMTETTALGAAYLAGLATGFWIGREEIAAQWAVDRRFEPQRSPDEIANACDRWNRAVSLSRGWQDAGS